MDDAATTFACPACGKKVSAPARFAGRTAPCPRCGNPLVVPNPPRSLEKEDPFSNLIGFNCRLCATRMYAPPDAVGTKVKCPDCYSLTVVPPPPAPPKSQRPKAMDEEGYELYEGEQPHGVDLARAAPPTVSFPCRRCQTHLSAEASRVGEPVTCPDCGAATPVPAPAKSPPKVVLTKETYEVDAAIDDVAQPTQRLSFDEYLQRPPAGYRTLLADDSPNARKVDIDAKPASTVGWGLGLFDGLVTSLIQPSMLLAWIGLSAGLLVVVLMIGAFVALCVSSDQTNLLGAIIFLSSVLFVTSLWLTIACTIYWAVMDSAATGARRVYDWPAFDFSEWVAPFTTVVFAVVISAIPGSIAAGLIPDATKLPWPLDTAFGWAVVGAMLVFPVVVLSQLNETSMWAIVSPGVLRTMFYAPVTWLAFYVAAFALAIGSMWIAEDLGESMGHWSLIAITPIEVLVDLVYAWLLGRLAWIAGAATPRLETTDKHG